MGTVRGMKTKLAVVALLALAPWFSYAANKGAEPVLHEVVDHLAPSNTLNVLTFSAPRATTVRELGLEDIGLTAGPLLVKADEIRIFANRDAINASPKARLWLNSLKGNRWWYQTGGEGAADEHVIQPGEMVIVITRATTREIAWTNVFRGE